MMRKALVILIVLFGFFLAIGCAGNQREGPNETGTPEQAVTEVGVVTGQEAVTPAEAVTPTGEKATERQNLTENSEIKEYTLEELAEYNGKNGKTYVAYQGKVYDVSDSGLWGNGTHKGHDAGKNLTGEMDEAPHGPGVLKNYPVVGTLKE